MLGDLNDKYVKYCKKNNSYHCELCDYKCSRMFLMKQHVATKKHQKKLPQKLATLATSPKNECSVCGKVYKERTGLWRHKKQCFPQKMEKNKTEKYARLSTKNILLNDESENLKDLVKVILDKIHKDSNIKEDIATQVIKQNETIHNDMLNQIKEQNKIIQDMVPCIGNYNNNQLNINVFLNETCRDAINMSEFLASLEIKLKDLKCSQQNGLTESISSILVNGLQELDTYKRPIHCTDMKREVLYIKDNDEWEKENGKEVLRYAINDVAEKQRKAIAQWEDQNPDWSKTDAGKDEYIALVKSVMTDVSNEKFENKIIKTIAKETMIK